MFCPYLWEWIWKRKKNRIVNESSHIYIYIIFLLLFFTLSSVDNVTVSCHIDIYMIEQLGCLYIYFISYDELASMKWGKKNNRGNKKKKKKPNEVLERNLFLFLFFPGCFPIYWEMEERRKEKNICLFSSLILILSVYFFLDRYIYIYLRCCCCCCCATFSLSLSRVSIIIHGTIITYIFRLLLFILSGGFSLLCDYLQQTC